MKLPSTTIKSNGWMQGDLTIWMVYITLCAISLIEVYSATSTLSYKVPFWSPIRDHAIFIFGGALIAWLFHLTPSKFFKLISALLVIISIPFLLWASFKSEAVNDAGRWVSIGGRSFQPSELAKLATIGFVAFAMAKLRTKDGYISSLGLKVISVLAVIMIGLIFTENFSTAGLLFLVVMCMLWIGRAPGKFLLWIILPLMALGGIGYLTLKNMSVETARGLGDNLPGMHRLPVWVSRLQKDNSLPKDPKDYDIQGNQQVGHAKIAVATSNIIGKGPGKSVERDYLPQAYSDFIYAIIIEESGIEGALLVLGLYLFLLYRCWRIAGKCAKRFPAYLVMGLSLMLTIQALVNMAVAVGLMPVTGQPLPLVSRGGTSILITSIYFGMIISVSRSAKQIEDESASFDTETRNEQAVQPA